MISGYWRPQVTLGKGSTDLRNEWRGRIMPQLWLHAFLEEKDI